MDASNISELNEKIKEESSFIALLKTEIAKVLALMLDRPLIRMALDIGIKHGGVEGAFELVGFELSHVDAIRCEAAKRLVERGWHVAHPEHERGDDGPVGRLGPRGLRRVDRRGPRPRRADLGTAHHGSDRNRVRADRRALAGRAALGVDHTRAELCRAAKRAHLPDPDDGRPAHSDPAAAGVHAAC